MSQVTLAEIDRMLADIQDKFWAEDDEYVDIQKMRDRLRAESAELNRVSSIYMAQVKYARDIAARMADNQEDCNLRVSRVFQNIANTLTRETELEEKIQRNAREVAAIKRQAT